MSVDGDTPGNPAWADDTWQYWLFEILADGTVNWYVDGAFIGAGELKNTGVVLDLVAQKRASAPAKKYYYDEVKMYTPSTDFAAWPGKITTDADEVYEMRIHTLYGYAQGQITNLDLNVDYDDITEHIEDVAVAASGTVYLPIVETYRSIVNVLLTIQDSGAETAIAAKVIDKNPGGGNGPEVETYDAAGARAAGHIDAKVKGY
jgi:hypothetical protein